MINSMESEIPLTVIVPTGNRVDVIEQCLQSVRWAKEVLVVDSYSSDGSYEIALKYADRVLRHEYGYSALQKNWAIPQASNEWVLIVDTDERVSPALEQEICQALKKSGNIRGYKIPRLNYLAGKPVLHAGYYPDYQLRLFMRDYGKYDLRRVHAHVVLDGEWGILSSPFYHYAHRNIDQTLQNLLILMTNWEAAQRQIKLGKRPGFGKKFLWFDMLIRPIAAFGNRYFQQSGWRDGYRGLIVSLFWAMYVSITYMKIWENDLNLPDDWCKSDWDGHK